MQEAEVGSDGHPILKETLIGVSYLQLKDLGYAIGAILVTRKVWSYKRGHWLAQKISFLWSRFAFKTWI